MARQLADGDEFALTKGRYGIGISWDDVPGGRMDVDLQAVIVDTKGQVIDAVYYNNLKALKCITHSGDETSGEKSGLDETIWVGLERLAAHVRMVIFVVAAFRGGRLRDVQNGRIHVLEERKENEVALFSMEQSTENVDVVAAMTKSDAGGWSLRIVDEPAQPGQHFIDVLEPTIGNIIRRATPGAPKRVKVAFAMEKGAVVDLPQSAAMDQIVVGLGWDTGTQDIDLDVSAVLFDSQGKSRDAVFFGNLQAAGLVHSGDNLTGEGSGDDETITVNLQVVPEWVQQIFLCVNIYSQSCTFDRVANPYCRVLDSSMNELARYELREAGDQNGLIIARLLREGGAARWGFQAIGTFCRGRTYKDSLGDMAPIFHKTPRDLQMRGASFVSLGQGPGVAAQYTGAPSAAVPAPTGGATPRPKESKACCTM